MLKFILKRILESVPVLFVIVTLTFFLAKWVPGGPFDGEAGLSKETLQSLNAHYGFDQPLYVQYGRYLNNLIHGDLGPSIKKQGISVNSLLKSRVPTSMKLGFMAVCFAAFFGIVMGTLAAAKPNTRTDHTLMGFSMTGICLPAFVLGPLLVLVFSLKLNWLNAVGWENPSDCILPVVTLGLMYSGYIARLMRASMLEVRNQDYMRTAFAKGLSIVRVLFVHGLRNAVLPVVTYLGPTTAALISGSLIIETVFNIAGVGRLFINAVSERDDTVIIGAVLFYSILIITCNLLVDIAIAILNPKQKLES
ncbi:MAG: ABC transporter [Verrucomicrobia bacterium GWC2_42_7]|nr:MAG: ABC transporter [Verrucomicrobia bacterium GWC2_42_7]